MKKRVFTQIVSLFVAPEMYDQVKQESDDLNISLSELFREMARQYFERQQDIIQPENCSDGGSK